MTHLPSCAHIVIVPVLQISALRQKLDAVREHRQQYRRKRTAVPVPVISLVSIVRRSLIMLLLCPHYALIIGVLPLEWRSTVFVPIIRHVFKARL